MYDKSQGLDFCTLIYINNIIPNYNDYWNNIFKLI